MNKQPDFTIVKAKSIPFWQVLHNTLTDDLKNEKYIKSIYKHSISEINSILKNGKLWCDDCGKPFDQKLPKNYEELSDFSCHIINSSVVRPCHDCMRKSIENGSVIGSIKDGWFPSKEKLLEEFDNENL